MSLAQRTQHILEEMGRGAVKLRGQHFLIDETILTKIIATSGVRQGQQILEIGPGLGFLTERLLAHGCKVTAIELDPGFADYLERHFAEAIERKDFTLLRGDALKIDLDAVFGGQPYAVVANIPYSISANLLEHLAQSTVVRSATLLVQKEVAERVCAVAPKANMQSLLLQSVFSTTMGFMVPAGVFMPPPKVQSAVLRLERRGSTAERTQGDVLLTKQPWFLLAQRAFLAPRKKISNTLGLSAEIFTKVGLTGDERPAELSLKMWKEIAEII